MVVHSRVCQKNNVLVQLLPVMMTANILYVLSEPVSRKVSCSIISIIGEGFSAFRDISDCFHDRRAVSMNFLPLDPCIRKGMDHIGSAGLHPPPSTRYPNLLLKDRYVSTLDAVYPCLGESLCRCVYGGKICGNRSAVKAMMLMPSCAGRTK